MSKSVYEEDRKLAQRVMRGDEKAFDAFFHLYYPRVYRFCQRRLSITDAEDVALETIRHAIRRIETYRGEAMLITWLYQVARSQVSAFYKRENKHQELVLIDDDVQVQAEVAAMASNLQDVPEAQREEEQRQHLIHFMLDSLPGNYGQVLQWKYIEGFSVEEIAEKLATTPTAIQSMLARARKAFRTTYDEIQDRVAQSPPTPLFGNE
jgi:RNA polymerase sigma-70 factor, ECF subfamily